MKGFLVISPILVHTVHSWVSSPGHRVTSRLSSRVANPAAASSTDEIKKSLLTSIAPTDRGRSATDDERRSLEKQFRFLEDRCSIREPARSPLVEGLWTVQYTDAPPPSNGKLGPFAGIAQQSVGLDDGSYQNILRVPPNDWLSASLDATWKEWDGVLLEDARKKPDYQKESVLCASPNVTKLKVREDEAQKEEVNNSSFLGGLTSIFSPKPKVLAASTNDFGATCWLVTFERLTIRLFGLPLFSQKFGNTRRVWRTTYVDENTRIVRAGRTGRVEDELVFYMSRATGDT